MLTKCTAKKQLDFSKFVKNGLVFNWSGFRMKLIHSLNTEQRMHKVRKRHATLFASSDFVSDIAKQQLLSRKKLSFTALKRSNPRIKKWDDDNISTPKQMDIMLVIHMLLHLVRFFPLFAKCDNQVPSVSSSAPFVKYQAQTWYHRSIVNEPKTYQLD